MNLVQYKICMEIWSVTLASSPGHSQILYRSCGEKSGEGLGSKLRHGLEMVDSVSTLCGLGFVMMATCPRKLHEAVGN